MTAALDSQHSHAHRRRSTAAEAHADGAFVPVQTRSERFTSFDPPTSRRSPAARSSGSSPRSPPAPTSSTASSTARRTRSTSTDAAGRQRRVDRPRRRPHRRGRHARRSARRANAWTSFEKALPSRSPARSARTLTVDPQRARRRPPRAAHTVIDGRSRTAAALVVLAAPATPALTENVEIVVGEGAHLTVVTLQEWDDDAVHLASHFARVGARREAQAHRRLARRRRRAGQPVDAPRRAGRRRRAVRPLLRRRRPAPRAAGVRAPRRPAHPQPRHLQGRAAGRRAPARSGSATCSSAATATGTDSYEQNRNLVLSDGTRADSIPNLEIETGDIAGAGHASATGRFDDEQLFYLQSRGITEDEARRLVVLGFLSEIVQKIGAPELEERLARRTRGRAARERCADGWRTQVCALDELDVERRPSRVVIDGVADRPGEGLGRRRARHRRHLHPRRHLALRGVRRGRHARVLGARLASSRCAPASR